MADEDKVPNTSVQTSPGGGFFSDAVNAVLAPFQFGYNIFANERNREDNLEQIKLTRDREDSAIQRRVADMRAAGLHPTLAAGTSGASSAPQQLNAPHPLKSAESVMQSALVSAQIQQMKAQTSLTMAEAERVRNYTAEKDPDYTLRRQLTGAQIYKLDQEIDILIADKIGKGMGHGFYAEDGKYHNVDYDTRALLAPREQAKLKTGLMDIARKYSQLEYDVDERHLEDQVKTEVQLLMKDLQYYDIKAVSGIATDLVGSISSLRKGRRSYNTYNNVTFPK